MRIETFMVLPSYGTNTYLIWDEASHEAMVVDMAKTAPRVIKALEEHQLRLKYIVNTHGHADHIGGNSYLKAKTGAPICIHPADAPKLLDAKANLSAFMGMNIVSDPMEIELTEGTALHLGVQKFTVLHTPGHSAGCICLYIPGMLISGDTLFAGSIGRTDFPDGNMAQLKQAVIEKLYGLPDDTVVYPGHGGTTTIGEEKQNNPFVRL